MTVLVLGELPEPVKLNAQLAVPPVPLSVQLPLAGERPTPLALKVAVPDGVVAVPADVSVTVAVQALVSPMTIGLVQDTVVEVVRWFTVIDPLDGPLAL